MCSDTSGPLVTSQRRRRHHAAPIPGEDTDAARRRHDRADPGGEWRHAVAAAMSAQRRSGASPTARPRRAGRAAAHAGRPLAVTALALALGTFMQVLDSTIANVSLPTIAGNLGVSTDQGTWVITAFAVANGIGVPLTGWLMGRYGVVRTFVVSVLAFTVASFLCGIAWSLPSLIFFRVLQGGVSGPMIPGSQALLISIFPADKRATALGIWSITTLVAPICGPILGGYISDNYHWGWIFLINVPVGADRRVPVAGATSKAARRPTRKLPIDTVGLGLLIVWVGALQVMLDTGKDADWFSSTTIVVAGHRHGDRLRRLPDLGTDREASDRRSVAVQEPQFRAGHAGLLPGLCGVLRQQSADAAVAADPDRLHRHLGGPGGGAHRRHRGAADAAVGARMMSRIDARIIATMAFVAFGVSYLMRAGFTADASFLAFMLPLLVQGIAMATFFLAMITILLDGVPPQRIPAGVRPVQFRAHHRGRLRRLDRHHPVGPARGAAPEPHGRSRPPRSARPSTRRWRICTGLGCPIWAPRRRSPAS